MKLAIAAIVLIVALAFVVDWSTRRHCAAGTTEAMFTGCTVVRPMPSHD